MKYSDNDGAPDVFIRDWKNKFKIPESINIQQELQLNNIYQIYGLINGISLDKYEKYMNLTQSEPSTLLSWILFGQLKNAYYFIKEWYFKDGNLNFYQISMRKWIDLDEYQDLPHIYDFNAIYRLNKKNIYNADIIYQNELSNGIKALEERKKEEIKEKKKEEKRIKKLQLRLKNMDDKQREKYEKQEKRKENRQRKFKSFNDSDFEEITQADKSREEMNSEELEEYLSKDADLQNWIASPLLYNIQFPISNRYADFMRTMETNLLSIDLHKDIIHEIIKFIPICSICQNNIGIPFVVKKFRYGQLDISNIYICSEKCMYERYKSISSGNRYCIHRKTKYKYNIDYGFKYDIQEDYNKYYLIYSKDDRTINWDIFAKKSSIEHNIELFVKSNNKSITIPNLDVKDRRKAFIYCDLFYYNQINVKSLYNNDQNHICGVLLSKII
jgi:hypothetical protein